MHTECLTQNQVELLRGFSPLMTKRGFYLGGGTALALFFGHRQSVDLDWFSQEDIGDVTMLASQIKREHPLDVSQIALGTLHAVANGVRISILEYTYPLLQPLYRWHEVDCYLASLDDLACMKLSAIAQRGAKKDFLDLYHLIRDHKPLPELLALYRQKYGLSDVMPVLYGLAYFTDANQEPQPLLCSDNWKTVKRAFLSWVREIT